MHTQLLVLLLLFFNTLVHAGETSRCSFQWSIVNKICQRFHQIWEEGTPELYLSGYAWHNRWTYTHEAIANNHYNELAWGGGFGKGFYDETGDWHGLYAIAFSDSHKNPQPIAGYSFLKIKTLGENWQMGGGFSALITTRADMYKGRPFPGAAPVAALQYKKISLMASYVPGKKNIGNVVFLLLKISL